MKRLMTALLAVLMAVVGQAAWAESEQVEIMRDATTVLNDFVNIPENAVPPALLSQAYGIAIIPDVIKAGFVVGGRYGRGVLSVRTADGSWSHPVFIKLAGASLGWQIGAASSDIILVFKNRRGVDRIVNGQITLGADVSIAAGPVGRTASAATNLQLDAEIYSYSRSRGLFAGIALEGGVITIAEEDNWRYYRAMADARTILQRNGLSPLPPTARRLVYTLDRYMPGLHGSGGAMGQDGTVDGGYGGGQPQPYADDSQARPYNNDYGQAQPEDGYDQPQVQQYNNYGQTRPYQPDAAGNPGNGGDAMRMQPNGDRGQAASNRAAPAPGSGSNNYGPVYGSRPGQ